MKKVLFGCAVAVLALFSACENLEPQVQTVTSTVKVNTEDAVIFTAGLGVDTKTYLEFEKDVYKTRWESADNIFILATNSDSTYRYEHADIIEGAGTSTAKFAASVNMKGEKYFAYYGANSYFSYDGKFSPELQEYQYRKAYYDEEIADVVYENNLEGIYFPMYAESDNTSFTFKNLCSILKVDLVGTDYIENVVFTPNDKTIPVAGRAELTMVNGAPELTFPTDTLARYSVCFYVQETLDPVEPVSCYISLPAQTYTGGFTLTINSASGSMTVETKEDVVLERSQIRAVPTITYENQVSNTWGLCGVMTDWTTDIQMTLVEQYFVLEDLALEAGQEFKFRANGEWTVNYGYVHQAIEPGSTIELTANGPNMYVTETGIYDIILDPNAGLAQFVRTDADLEYITCETYDEVAALPDNTLVLLQGIVFASYGRGFVMNIGQYWENCILVYQGTDQSYYTPVVGNTVAMIAKKVTYNNLPEITDIQAFEVLSDGEYDYGYDTYYNLMDPEVFKTIEIDRYQYVKYAGTLKKEGNYYNVIIDGVTERKGSLEFPTQDLTEFLDKKVAIEGYFIGFVSGGKYLKTVLKSIQFVDDEGSTEDVIPGDDIVVTSKASSKVVE